MKRFAALLTALIFLLSASALAFNGVGYPAWDGVSAPDNSLCGAFGSDRISMTFDPSDEYSVVEEGIIQACFFTYDAAEESFLEMYLLLPDDVAAGDVLRIGDGRECALYLYEFSLYGDTLYFAGDLYDSPDGSSFALTIDSAETTDSAIHISGHLTAYMCRYEDDQVVSEYLTVSQAQFDFTLPVSSSSFHPAPTQEPGNVFPALPDATFPALPDAPAFTLPPDYVTI